MRFGPVLALALGAAFLVPGRLVAGPAPHHAVIDGQWDAPGGRILLTSNGGHVVGVMASPASGLALRVGEKVLEGDLEEDNLTADVRLGVVAPRCGSADGTAFVVLLATRSGRLVGGASSKAACAAKLSSVTMTRGTEAARPAMVGEPAPGEYDPRGRRATPLDSSVRSLLTDGLAYMNEGQFEKARRRFEEARARNPAVGESYNGIGATYAARQDYGSAIEWYKRGLDAAPGFGDLFYNLACAYAQFGKPALALRYLRLAAVKGYAEVGQLDADHDLDPLRRARAFASIREQMIAAGGQGR